MRRQTDVAAPARRLTLGGAFLLALTALAGFAPSALASNAHFLEASFGPDGTAATSFAPPGAVGVDQASHDIYVADLNLGTVSKFDESHLPADFSALGSNEITGFSFFAGAAESQIAVNSTSHYFYVVNVGGGSIKAFAQDGEPAEFTALGSSEITGFGEVCGVAVDQNGAIYAGDYAGGGGVGKVSVYAPSGTEITSFATDHPCNLAVDSTGHLYVNHWEFNVEKFTPSVFPVSAATAYTSAGIVDEGPAKTVAVDPSNDDLYVDDRTRIAQYDKDGEAITTFPASGDPGQLTSSEGLAIDGASGKVYVSDADGEKQVEAFAPPPPIPPSVGAISFANATASSADLQAQVNPNFFPTTYRFQYVTQAQFETGGFTGAAQTPEGALDSAGTVQIARARISGLVPDTTYRFRVVAGNGNGVSVFSAEVGRLTTFPISAPGLPDGRAYEMVSPPQKTGEVFPPEPHPYLSGSCPRECLPGTTAQLAPMQSTPNGSSVAYQGQPFSGGLAAGPNEYLGRRSPGGWESQSLSTPLFASGEGQGYAAFSTDLSRGVLFQIEPALSAAAPTRGGESFANLYLRDAAGGLQPLVSAEPPQREPGVRSENRFRVDYAGANAGTGADTAFSHVIFEANDALTAAVPGAAPAAAPIAASERNLYEWVNGTLRLVNVAPGNGAAVAGATIGSGEELFEGANEGADFDRAISADGSRVFWSEVASGQVYVRIDGAETVKVGDPGRYLVASADGARVLLSDGCLYDLAGKTCENLSAGEGGFQGILGAAEDLSRVYFVDTAVLSGGEENANGEKAEAGEFNLYAWDKGATSFIGGLLAFDNYISGVQPIAGDWRPSASSRTAQVSPDGAYLAFMSRAPLTGQNSNVRGGAPCLHAPSESSACYEVFEYEAGSRRLSCPSCNPSGEAPLGGANLSLVFRGLKTKSGFPQPANLSTGVQGRLFFESRDDLSPFDTNGGVQDVYEWEPAGVGSCGRAGGCLSLISSGHSSVDSMFFNATPSGNDAFLVTREQLLAQDKDQRLDLYDARVGGGIATADVPAPCGGETCKGPLAAAPAQPAPASSSFNGPRNKKPAHHKKKHKKQKKKHKRSAKHNRGGSK